MKSRKNIFSFHYMYSVDKKKSIYCLCVDDKLEIADLVDEADLVLYISQTFLYSTDVLYVLLHHIQLSVIVEFIHTLSQFLQFCDHLLSLLQELSFSGMFRFLNELNSKEYFGQLYGKELHTFIRQNSSF